MLDTLPPSCTGLLLEPECELLDQGGLQILWQSEKCADGLHEQTCDSHGAPSCAWLADSYPLALCRTYRLSQNVKPLIWVECMVNKKSRSRTEYLVKAKSQFKERSTATNVEILLPLPADAITPTVRASQVGPAYCRNCQMLSRAG